MKNTRIIFVLFILICTLFGCEEVETPVGTSESAAIQKYSASEVLVSNIEQLYEAVNNPNYVGYCIVLAAQQEPYMLDPTRENGGRLELQFNMSLRGKRGHAGSVVIDASLLDAAALTDGFLTGAIRVGRGSNTIEWLTVQGATQGAAAIETDLTDIGPAQVHINNVIVSGNTRGLDIRNIGSEMAHRTLNVELTDNAFNNNITKAGQGVRLVNTNTSSSSIQATLRNNFFEDNIAGCLVANLNTDSSSIIIESIGNEFERNGNGCIFLTGTSSDAGYANNNSITFTAHAGSIQDNGGSLLPPNRMIGGIIAIGGNNSSGLDNHSSNNLLSIKMWGVKVRNNDGPDIAAWGAWTAATLPAGTNNSVEIVLHGVSKFATDDSVPSEPVEPGGTNTVTIIR